MALERAAVSASTRSGRPWTRSRVSSWRRTGTPSADARTSNSRPSQPGTASAASNAASVFSGARRQSPRWASRSVRAGMAIAATYPISSRAAMPEVVARVERRVLRIGPVEGEARIDRPRTAPRTQM